VVICTTPFAADALSYLASLGTLAMIRKPMQEAAAPLAVRGVWKDLAEGLRWAIRQRSGCAPS
jgi:hypothetical protein